MAVFRTHRPTNYFTMGKTHLKDKNLSLKAKGLLSMMLSFPDNWKYSIEGLVSICKEGDRAVVNALNELKKHKYVVTTKLYPNQTESHRIEYIYDVYQDPQNVGVENVVIQKSGQYNNNNIYNNNKEKENKKKYANFEQREYTEEDLRKLYNNI